MRYFFFTPLCFSLYCAQSQSTDLPLNSPAYAVYDEWDVRSGSSDFTTVKPISRLKMANASKEAKTYSKAEYFDKSYIEWESREYLDTAFQERNPFFGRFYRYPTDFVSVQQENFDFHLNPVLALEAGKESGFGDVLFENYRGLELRGTIDDKVSFYTLLTENQARYPTYVKTYTDSTLGVPYEGFWKQYEVTGVDFLRAQGYVDFNISRHISAQFGYGKHFIGNGVRSLILSDFGNNYPYLKIQTQIWKFQYTNIFAKLIAQTGGGDFGLLGTGSFPNKHLAFHHLGINLFKNFHIGLFESVIYGSAADENLRVEYLNPIIFYRSLEQQDGSADNAILGLDFKWNLFRSVSLYGQVVIDELIVSKALSGDGYWENKQGYQLGIKYIDAFGLPNLKLQAEWNQVRPYTYAHQDHYTAYSHYNMPLAHPLGANFREILSHATYRVTPKLTVSGDVLLAKYGTDPDSASYGKDLLKSYNLRTGDENIKMFHGDETDLRLIHLRASYQIIHNLTLNVDLTYRQEQSASKQIDRESKILSVGLRFNFPYRNYLF